jgi:cell wall-associated NlpC family hydrolase
LGHVRPPQPVSPSVRPESGCLQVGLGRSVSRSGLAPANATNHPDMSIDRRQLLSSLIGKRWAANGRGPNEFDCWHLARHIESRLFGRELPSVDVPDAPGWAWMLQAIGAHPEQANWLERPQANGLISAGDGALVLMARAQRAAHIGVWLLPEQGVIHCDQTSGVVLQDAATLRAAGWRKLMFYEPRIQDRC